MARSSVAPPPPGLDDQPPAGGSPGRARIGRRRAFQAAVAVVVVAGAGVGIWLGTRGGSPATTASPISVTTQRVTVSTGTMKDTVAASGTLEPAQDSTLAFAVSGTVSAVDVKTGQQVAAGQILASLEPSVLSDQVAAAQATLTADQDRLSSDQAAGASTSQIDADQATVTSAQAQLSSAQANLADATLKAPFSGTVAAVNLAVGDSASGGGGNSGAGSSGSGGSSNRGASSGLSALLGASSSSSGASSGSSASGITIISAGRFTVTTSVDDTEVGKIKVGDQAVIEPSGSTTPVYGTVSSVGLIASSGSGVASFPVTIGVTGSPSGLYAGASASVSVIVEQLDNVVEVPTAALSYSNGQASVTEIVNGSPVSQPVTTGISANGYTQITGGLKPGDVVTERVVRFKAASGSSRSLFGNGASGRGPGGGGFGGGFRGGQGGGFFGGGPGGGGPGGGAGG